MTVAGIQQMRQPSLNAKKLRFNAQTMTSIMH